MIKGVSKNLEKNKDDEVKAIGETIGAIVTKIT